MRRVFAAALLAAAAALAPAAPAAAQIPVVPKSKCSAAKLKAVGAYYAALAKCAATAVAKDQSLDPLCVTKAQVKLQGRFARAERKDDCRTWRESVSIQELLDEGFADALAILEPPPSVCCATSAACFWVADAAACTTANGTIGAPGSVCSVDACAPPPAAEARCCEGVTIPNVGEVSCVSSSFYDEPTCTSVGGTFVDDAVCLPGRVCID